ncbi:DUF1983 domain-containing protein [Pseudophaeobacter sp. C1-32P7]|uniref:phage tail protein n=1 Tax=Pseudophaeobacter sp. C1-32P7 TaxID=3098142 RepID=UPI0034D7888A
MKDRTTFCAVLVVAMLAPVAASADPITAWVASTFAVSATTAAFIVRTAFSLALTALSSALAKKPGQPRHAGIKTETTTTGGTNPQTFILGKYATSGNMVAPPYSHPNSGTVPNEWLTYVVDVSDIPGVQLSRIMVGGQYITDLEDSGVLIQQYPSSAAAGAHDVGGMIDDDGPYFFMTWHDGTQTEADAYMMENYSDHPDRPWSADMVGTGVAYAVVSFAYNRKLFNQLPAVRFEVLGIPLYDPRKDGSVGGAGAHRWNDPSTWEHSQNPIVMVYNILRGVTLPDGHRWGGGVAADDLPLDNWFAAMNECDLAVPRKSGGTVTQYRAGLEVSLDQEPAGVIDELLKACSGEIAEMGGVYKVRVGPPALPVYFFTDDDISADHPQNLAPYPGLDGVHNAIHVSHPSPASLWETRDAPPRYNAEWEVEDGGRQLVASVDLPAVFSGNQAQRLAKAWIEDERRFRRHSLTLPPDAAILEPLDTVGWTSAREGYDAKVFEVGEITDDLVTCFQTVAIRERDSGDFAWSPEVDEVEITDPSPLVTLPAPRTVSGFNLLSFSLVDGAALARRPGLRLVWDAAQLAETDVLKWRLQLADGTPVASGTVADPESGEFIISAGILPVTEYRAKMRVISRLGGEWTAWDTAVTSAVRFGLGDLDQAALDAIQDDATSIASSLDADVIAERIEPIDAAVANLNRDLQLQSVDQRSAAEALAVIGDQVLWAISRISDVDGRMADAGIVVDPDTGTVRIYALEQEAERISETEIRLNAAEANIALSATQTYVDQRVSEAVLDPTQVPLLDNLQVQVNQVTLDLDAVEAALELKASQTVVDGLSVSLTEAVADIDALNEAITFKVDQASFDDYASRLETAEVQISTLDGPQISQTVADSRALQDAADLADIATLGALLQAYEDRESARQDLAYATQDLHARVDDEREARAAVTFSLGAAIDENMALIEAERKVRASETAAIASDVVQLDARLTSAEGNISGQATAISSLTTQVTDNETGLVTLSQDLVDLSARVTTAEGNVAGNAGAVQALDARVTDAEGNIFAQATSLTSLSTTVGQNSSSISQALTSIDGISAEYTLRIDNNGVVSGMVLRSDLDDNGTAASEVAFVSDKFAIVAPDGNDRTVPFAVYTTPRVIDGITYPAGVYIKDVFLGRAAIGRAQIEDIIQSDNYAQDADGTPTSGLRMNFNTGKIKAAGPVISRNIIAAEGSFWTGGPITVNPANGLYQVTSWDLVETGLEVPVNQVWMASNKTYIAYAAFDGQATAPGGISGTNEFWGCKVEVQPFARWSGPQQLYLRIELWAKGISALTRSGEVTKGGKIHWKLYEVT